jgi:high-affinity iron transporter
LFVTLSTTGIMTNSEDVFAVPVFFICFRESLETSIIVSVLLSFLKQTLASEGEQAAHKRLVKQVWFGTGLGLLICIIIGAGMIGMESSHRRNAQAHSR